MIFLPIVERELRVASRLPATFRNRALTAGIVAAVAVLMMLFAGMTASPAFIGGTAFLVLSILTLCFCLLEGVRKTADCLSEEKREGTLGLLFLTDLKGYDVVFGKLAATSLNSFYGLMAILPVLALPLLLGGVTPGEYWRVALALLNILFFSLCAGMFVSSRSFQQQQAAGGALLVIILFSAVPLLTFTRMLYPLSPVYPFYGAFDANYPGASNAYWKSLGFTQVWSWLLLVWASVTVLRSWQDNEAGALWRVAVRRRRYWRPGRVVSRETMLATNPIFWLAARDQSPTPALNLSVLIALAGAVAFVVSSELKFLLAYVICAILLNLFLKMLLAARAARFFAEARSENALEMLLSTPLTVNQIINGQILALERVFLFPVICILLLEFGGAMVGIISAGFSEPQREISDALTAFIPGAMIYLFLLCADVAAVVSTGMWFGLTSEKESQAGTKTVLWVVVAPLVALLLWCPGYIYFACSSFFWMFWATSRLYDKLREMAGRRYALLPVDMYSQPAPSAGPPRITPPIINP
jgi:ABC-type transport system involved in multi-copper enzyme maturation permease subunit